MARLIGLCGYAGVGKDSIAAALTGFTALSFAAAVKRDLDPLFQRAGLDIAKREDKEQVRPIIVCYGDGMRKHVDPEFWVKQLAAVLPMYGDVVVTDVRYPNEAEFILNQGGHVFYVSRTGHGPANETEGHTIPALIADYHKHPDFHFVANDRTPADAAAAILELIEPRFSTWTNAKVMGSNFFDVDLDACGTIDGVTPLPPNICEMLTDGVSTLRNALYAKVVTDTQALHDAEVEKADREYEAYLDANPQERARRHNPPCYHDESCVARQIADHPLFAVTIIDGEDAKEFRRLYPGKLWDTLPEEDRRAIEAAEDGEAVPVSHLPGPILYATTVIDGEGTHERIEKVNADDPVVFTRRDVYIAGPEGEPRVCRVHEIAKLPPVPTSLRNKSPWYVRAKQAVGDFFFGSSGGD